MIVIWVVFGRLAVVLVDVFAVALGRPEFVLAAVLVVFRVVVCLVLRLQFLLFLARWVWARGPFRRLLVLRE